MSIYDSVPRYLTGKYELVSTVTFTALFSLVFILVSIPFSHNVWFSLNTSALFVLTTLFFLTGLLVVVVSKMILYRMRNSLSLNYLQLVLWDVCEVVVISALYTFFTVSGDARGIIDLGGQNVDHVFFGAFINVFISLGVPYVIAAEYFAIGDKNNTIRLMNYSGVVSDVEIPPQEEKRITLFDNSGALKLSVTSSNLYYIESDDNYIKVWYSDSDGTIKMYMLRCRLKTVEDSFADSDLVRCHRKYIVNVSKVSVLRREKDSYYIDLAIEGAEPIPVSKTYEECFLSRFNSR